MQARSNSNSNPGRRTKPTHAAKSAQERLRDKLVNEALSELRGSSVQKFGRYDRSETRKLPRNRSVMKTSQVELGEFVDDCARPPMRVRAVGPSMRTHLDNFRDALPGDSLRDLTRWAEDNEAFEYRLKNEVTSYVARRQGDTRELKKFSKSRKPRKGTYKDAKARRLKNSAPLSERLVPVRKKDESTSRQIQDIKSKIDSLQAQRNQLQQERAKRSKERSRLAKQQMRQAQTRRRQGIEHPGEEDGVSTGHNVPQYEDGAPHDVDDQGLGLALETPELAVEMDMEALQRDLQAGMRFRDDDERSESAASESVASESGVSEGGASEGGAELMELLATAQEVDRETLRLHMERFLDRDLDDEEYSQLLEAFGCPGDSAMIGNEICRKLLGEICE